MTSVIQRIRAVQQPRGGYVNPSLLEVRYPGGDGPMPLDHKVENVAPSLVGTAVDYLVRLGNGAEPTNVFRISLMGAERLGPGDSYAADYAVGNLTRGRVDSQAIRTACRLVNYDVVYRVGPGFYNPDAPTAPNQATEDHIAEMVERSLAFFHEYGPVTLDGFTFDGAYTDIIQTGDGDFLTHDTIWEFKVSVAKPTAAHTLQLLIYYLMGKRSTHPEFRPIMHLGIFNPRLNAVYRVPAGALPVDTIAEVELSGPRLQVAEVRSRSVVAARSRQQDQIRLSSGGDEFSSHQLDRKAPLP